MENSLNQVVSDLIIEQMAASHDPLDLRADAPVLGTLHPKMIRAQVELSHNPEREPQPLRGFYAFYANISEAKQAHPKLSAYRALPWTFSTHRTRSAIFDLAPHGAFVLSTEALADHGSAGPHQHTLPPFLEYALSAELWGTQGKWTRFHERLHTLFDKYKLLNAPDLPGRYPLKEVAQKLERRGIKGTLDGGSFVLTMPWTFPLTALNKLEAVVQEEF